MLQVLRMAASFAVTVLLAAPVRAGSAEPVFFILPPEALPNAVSADGYVVVGSLFGLAGRFGRGAFYWTPLAGLVEIGGTQGVAVSRDGQTIVGRAVDANGDENAAIWLGGREWRTLGSFSPTSASCDMLLSGAFGASADAHVIVGLGWDGCRLAQGFRWEETTGVVDLGSSVAGRSSRANAISGDARRIVGWQDDSFGFRQGAWWVDGRQELVVGPFGPVGEAKATNHDGSIVVGLNCDPATRSAWKWTAATGVVCLAAAAGPTDRPYVGMMLSTSDDGRVIGGARSFGQNSEAVLWLDDRGVLLRDYLEANGSPDAFRGFVNTGFIEAVSPDGRVLVGSGAGPTTFTGYVVILPDGADTGVPPMEVGR